MNNTPNVDLSVVVTAHSEGILLHKTLKSVERAASILTERGFSYEVIIHIDSPTAYMKAYLKANKSYLSQFALYENFFKDSGASRNFCIEKAAGTFVTFIDGDDLVSKYWLADALKHLSENHTQDIVAHPALTVEFDAVSNIVTKHGEIDRTTDSLLSVFANRWNVVLMTKRSLLVKHPYCVDPQGYGFEDWNLNNRFIYAGYHNILIPESVIFVRRKAVNSRWSAQQGAQSIVRSSELTSFKHIRSLHLPEDQKTDAPRNPATLPLIHSGKQFLQKHPRLYSKARHYYLRLKSGIEALPVNNSPDVPDWLLAEWKDIHNIEKHLYPSELVLAATRNYDSITPAHWEVGLGYKRLVDATAHDSYDYLIFTPWVSRGGADKFVIAYANQIQAAAPKKRVLVIATLPTESSWKEKLTCDFLSFGELTRAVHPDLQMRLLEQFIENSGAQYIHIINAALAYDFVATHAAYIHNSSKHVVATSFSQSTDDTGRIFGYSHTHVPEVYELCDFVTSDNQAVLDMWHKEYGFDVNKTLLHRPLVELPKTLIPIRQETDSLRVLWAARLAPEKMPELVAEIGRLIQDDSITIDMYGAIDEGFDTSFLQHLPSNVTYKGGYDGPTDLPMDQYDAFLYTSQFDGIPNVLAEVGSAGLPIVASHAGGIPEIVTDEYTGLLVNATEKPDAYAHALQLLKSQPTLRKKLAHTMREHLEQQYSETAYKARVVDMLARLDYLD